MRSYNRHTAVTLLIVGMTILLAFAADWLMTSIKLTNAIRSDPSAVLALPATLINSILFACLLFIIRSLSVPTVARSTRVILVVVGLIGTLPPLLDVSMAHLPPFYTLQLLTFPTTYTGHTCACLLVVGLYALRISRTQGTPHE